MSQRSARVSMGQEYESHLRELRSVLLAERARILKRLRRGFIGNNKALIDLRHVDNEFADINAKFQRWGEEVAHWEEYLQEQKLIKRIKRITRPKHIDQADEGEGKSSKKGNQKIQDPFSSFDRFIDWLGMDTTMAYEAMMQEPPGGNRDGMSDLRTYWTHTTTEDPDETEEGIDHPPLSVFEYLKMRDAGLVPGSLTSATCETCGREFVKRMKIKQVPPLRFCSLACYYKSGKIGLRVDRAEGG